ncbi:putative ankyrin repeat protein [Purpureocillium lavendulum]|uniref:Ankyrin repeat protein n=1 Tax=Purpureocillium lavendulum TaxID=1247861 RepID=A0AB34FG68_9HYPO|nr:putative ankyrin repeat protein [Purpureocillium lavendulum]
MADKYILRITAGPAYDEATHVEVPVNRPEPINVAGAAADVELCVRIRDYEGLPHGSPASSPYFDAEPHAYNQDQYSIALRFTPKRPQPAAAAAAKDSNGASGRESSSSGGSDESDEEESRHGISGMDLQFGNDFDRPIRDRLPPGFNTAMSIVRWWIDPGLDGDAYADKPYLYGPALSSFNALHVGRGHYDEARGGLWFDEGGDDEGGLEARRAAGAPDDGKARMKWALRDASKERWVFEYGRTYGFDFFNPYLDFRNLALRLPGFHLPIIKYWDGQGLRYVLRNRSTGEVYLVVIFTIYLKEDVGEDGTIRHGAAARAASGSSGSSDGEGRPADEETVLREAREKLGATHIEETSADDVD